jgi:hypothetical protein
MVRDGAAAHRSAEEADIRPPVAWNQSPLRSPLPLFGQFRLLLSSIRGVYPTRQRPLLAPGPVDFSSLGNRNLRVYLSTEIRAICFIKKRRGGPRWDAGCGGSRRLSLLLSCPPSRVGRRSGRGPRGARHLSLQFADSDQATFPSPSGLRPYRAGEESRRILQNPPQVTATTVRGSWNCAPVAVHLLLALKDSQQLGCFLSPVIRIQE